MELSLYATMPLFHFHTFLALSIVVFFLFVFQCATSLVDLGAAKQNGSSTWRHIGSRMGMSKHLLLLVAAALIPATFFVWLTTDHFQAGSILGWQPGWVQADRTGDMSRPSFNTFWFVNFGVWFPLVLTFICLVTWRVWKTGISKDLPEDTVFLIPAVVIFLLTYLVRFAPWAWDNLKLMIWAYFIILPFLWRDLIQQWAAPVRILVCLALFGSGLVSLLGGLAAGTPGFEFAKRPELDLVSDAVRQLPVEARFAAFPTYNHPLLLQGRKVVMGYPGHLWTQGFADYAITQNQLRDLMQGASDWRQLVQRFGVRYIFWGREEETNYPSSTRPWEKTAQRVKSGKGWGTIYDLAPIDK
jgi:hypothetical protein